jgi:hypothetical protein
MSTARVRRASHPGCLGPASVRAAGRIAGIVPGRPHQVSAIITRLAVGHADQPQPQHLLAPALPVRPWMIQRL